MGEEKGFALFDGVTSVENALTVAYSLEEGLKQFYEDMAAKVEDEWGETTVSPTVSD
jgi:rubrerythrin